MIPAINIKNLTFDYGQRHVLRDINLTIEEGEYVALIGPNGAGKSTLLKCLNRIVSVHEGTIELFGKNLKNYRQKEIGALVAYVSQHHEQSFSFSVFEFVLMARYPHLDGYRPPTKEDENKAQQALDLVGLPDFAGRKISRISGGERQKVYIAAALAQEPRILLLDEPTAHLDPRYHADIQKLICKVSRDLNLTVLHVTHDLNHIFSWSHKVVALKEEKLFKSGTPQEVLTRDHLKSIFQADFIFVAHPQTKQPIIIPEMS